MLDGRWLGRVPYREAWRLQHDLVVRRAAGEIPDQLLLLEHEAVLTLGKQADPAFVRATQDELAQWGIELIRVERGGEVTYHGPGQLVAYPIVKLSDRGVMLRPFVRALEAAMSQTAEHFGVAAGRREGYPGCWCDPGGARPRKLGALGLRVERGVTYHGIALNVTTQLSDFELIEACGIPGVTITSIGREAGWNGKRAQPSTQSVAESAVVFATTFEQALQDIAERALDRPTERDLVGTGAT
ncbi:MAG: lipoyl(octanoyl) transferase LipB [Chloroflexi bacterium]|nr:lipoyl(octanoyl) transferase LipB [Chloroflexota bacterium]